MKQSLTNLLRQVATRLMWQRRLQVLAGCWLLLAVLVLVMDSLAVPDVQWVLGTCVLSGMVLWTVRRPALVQVARVIEAKHPELNDRLLTALEQQPSVETGELSILQRQVVREALLHHDQHPWTEVVSRKQLLRGVGGGIVSALLLAAVGFWVFQQPEFFPAELQAGVESETVSVDESRSFRLTVEPGHTELERHAPLLVLGRFDGRLPGKVTLVVQEQNVPVRRVEMVKSLDDPLFGARVTRISNTANYHIEYDNQVSESYRVSVYDHPELQQVDASIEYPSYTQKEPTILADAPRVSVLEGAKVTLNFQLNKPVANATLRGSLSERELQPVEGKPHEYRVTFRPDADEEWTLHLVDDANRENKYPPEIGVTLVPNRRPELKFTFPARDLKVSRLEEMTLEGTAWDDFGITQYGVVYSVAGRKLQTVTLGSDVAAEVETSIAHLLACETLSVEPDQLISYYLFADDFGPDGKPRRTFSDMFFAEVRPFEEIFRQGQQPPGGQSKKQGGQGKQNQQVEQLAQQQKQIINATWKLLRRESSSEVSDRFTADVELIRDSQTAVIEAAKKQAAKLKNPKSKALMPPILDSMTQAVEALNTALERNSVTELNTALAAEQAAYQGLLKLRAREHNVVKGQSGQGSGSSSGNRSQSQLNNLKISQKENRYQTEKKASEQSAAPANREQLQVLNRLRELARRQEGINNKLKELELMLKEAKTEQEREELRRQLKRLREEQRQMLRDVDELQQRMNKQKNQSQMAESRKQLEQTREHLQKSSEALEKGKVSKALNEGTRAQRDLKNLRDDFRQKTASQFADAMRDLKHQTQDLLNKQEQIAQNLNESEKKPEGRPSLRRDPKRENLERQLGDQKQQLDRIEQQMRKVIQEAEKSEPLLSRQLYETVRKLRTHQPSENLNAAKDALNRGLKQQAKEAEQQARQGIQELQKGVEQAANGVLGNELESLKRAKQELERLSQSVQKEVVQNKQGQANTSAQKPGANGSKSPNEKPSQNPSGQPKQGKQSGQSNKPGSANSKSPSESKSSSSKPGQQPGQANGNGMGTGSPKDSQSSGKPSSQPSGGRLNPSLKNGGRSPKSSGQPGSQRSSLLQQGGNSGGPGGPLTGQNFQEFSDRLRDVEEMISDPKLRAEVARVRERARSMRAEFKRHSKTPNWQLVESSVLQPLVDLEDRIAEEIHKRDPQKTVVPIDRDPVPERYSDIVERYYEELGEQE